MEKEISKLLEPISRDWMLISAGPLDGFNTMTASWGGFSVLWGMNVAVIYVRPSRHTYKFLEENDTFSLSFFGGEEKKALTFCGRHSGRDTDKMKETGLVPKDAGNNTVTFTSAKRVIVCKKLAFADMKPENFVDQSIHEHYADKSYHRIYFGQILTDTTL